MPLIEVEPGIRVFAQDVGSGAPVVLVAGFGLSHEVWDPTVRALLDAGQRAVCVDLRGTGGSDKPAGGYDMERLSLDVEDVLDVLDLRDVALVGWSFGGQVALRLAARSPERLARLALVGSNGVRASRSEQFPFGPPGDKVEAALVRAEIERRIATRRKTVASGFLREPDPELLDWLVRCQLRMPSWAAVACYRTYLHTDLVAELDRIELPVLLLTGEQDPVTPAEGAPWVAERLADARVVAIPDCGHYPMFEARERFDDALLGFVGER